MKPIPKSSRESNRYISCKISTSNSNNLITYTDFSTSFEATALEMVGKLGIASLGLQVVKDQYVFPNAVIKTNAGQERVVRAIICSMTKIKDTPVKVESTKTSGTIHNVASQSNPRKRVKKSKK